MSPRGEPGPVEVLLVDLDRPEPVVGDQGRHPRAWLVGFRSGVPVGIAKVDRTASGAIDRGVQELSALAPEPHPVRPVPDAELPSISVVVPSVLARTDELAACLSSLTAADYPAVEVLLVDNRRALPVPDPLPDLLERFPLIRAVRAEQPGISAARNAGIKAATGTVVVFTDDDVQVHPGWLRAIGSRFARDPSLAAVTGLILPAELETPAQIYFERYYGGFSGVRTFVPLTLEPAGMALPRDRARVVVRDLDGVEQRSFALYGIGAYGAGANMAFSREALLGVGGFNLALGTGTRARGGEDLATLIDVLWQGGRVGYEPAAVVLHQHRRSEPELVRQLVGNGLGFTAMLTSLVLADRRHLVGIAGQLPLALQRATTQLGQRLAGRRTDWPRHSPDRASKAYPSSLVLHELSGMVRGPFAYLRSRRDAQVWDHALMTSPARREPAGAAPPPFLPIPVEEFELAGSSPAPVPNAQGQIALLVRLHGVPLGSLSLLEPGAATGRDLAALARERFAEEIHQHLATDGLSGGPAAVPVPSTEHCLLAARPSNWPVSVVVCTLGADPRLRGTVTSLLEQTHRDLEVVVVDNRPGEGRVAGLLDGLTDPRLRVVEQPRRGLSAARNAGIAAARGEVVAFTDDDAFADPDWVRQLVAPFEEDARVACVTGLVLPAEITTQAQAWFEEFGAFDKGFRRLVWSLDAQPGLDGLGERGVGGVLFPYSAGVYGSGNNMAFRTDWLRRQPLFDEALGAGSLTKGGEDLDAFLRVMLAGAVLVYEPRALVRHFARGDLDGLRSQMYGYGSGMAAVVVKHVLAGPRAAGAILLRLPAGLRKLLDPASDKNAARSAHYPAELARTELRGYAAGPLLYARSRREAARRRRSSPG